MSAGQGESSLRMIENCAAPTRPGAMTNGAIQGQTGSGVIRIGGALVLRKVAGVAVSRRAGEIGGRVALIARQVYVAASQLERRLRVIERRTCPIDSAMAYRTREREPSLHVVRVSRGIVERQMAGVTIGGRTGKLAIGVA